MSTSVADKMHVQCTGDLSAFKDKIPHEKKIICDPLNPAQTKKIQEHIKNLANTKSQATHGWTQLILSPLEKIDDNVLIHILSFLGLQVLSIRKVSKRFNALASYSLIECLNAKREINLSTLDHYERVLNKDPRQYMFSLKTISVEPVDIFYGKGFIDDKLRTLIQYCAGRKIALAITLKFSPMIASGIFTDTLFNEHCEELRALLPRLSLGIDLEACTGSIRELLMNLAVEFALPIKRLSVKGHTKIKDMNIWPLLSVHPDLNTIDLTQCSITDHTLNNISAFCYHLNEVRLDHTKVTVNGLLSLAKCPLRVLSLRGTSLDSFDLVTLAREIKNLETVDLSASSSIQEGGVKTLIQQNTNLRGINLYNCSQISATFKQQMRENYPLLIVL